MTSDTQSELRTFEGWSTERLLDFLREHADGIQGGEYGESDAAKLRAAANRLERFYFGTSRAEPAAQLDKARARIRIYRKQIREAQQRIRELYAESGR